MTSLTVCTKCEEEERLETKQKEFELNQFKVIIGVELKSKIMLNV